MPKDETEKSGSSSGELAQTDDIYLGYFMEESGLAEAHDMTLVDPIVWSRIINPLPRRDIPEQPESVAALRNIHKQNKPDDSRKFGPFTPRMAAQVRAVREASTEEGFNKARRVHQPAGESFYAKLQKRSRVAESEVAKLKKAVGTDGVSSELDLNQLRQSDDALYLLGDRLMRREFFENHYWPAKNTVLFRDRQAYWRGAMLAASHHGSDELLNAIFDNEVQELENEMVYWGSMKRRIDKTVGGQAVKASLIHKEGQRSGLLDELEAQSAAEPGEDDEEEDESYSQRMPEHVRRHQIARYAAATQRIKNRIQQDASPEAAEKKEFAGGRAIWDEGRENIMGVELPDQRPHASTIAEAAKPKSNPAHNPGVRRSPAYDKQDDPSNPRPF